MTSPRLLLLGLLLFATGCGMFGAWRSIPPPGGCDRCHQVSVSANWRVAYVPATLVDEHDRLPWQLPEGPPAAATSTLEERKLTEQPCFDCHQSPDPAHGAYKGRYHH